MVAELYRDAQSRSGPGSTIEYTANVRALLARALREHSIATWIDAPCGDCNWQPTVDGIDKVQYLGLDIVPNVIEANTKRYANRDNLKFAVLDFAANALPFGPDLVLCRDMVQHNTLLAGTRTYANFEASGAKYLVTTSHFRGSPEQTSNVDITPGDWYAVNLFLPPFNFSAPLYWTREGEHGRDGASKFVGVWKLPALSKGDGKGFMPSAADWERAADAIVDVAPGSMAGAVSGAARARLSR